MAGSETSRGLRLLSLDGGGIRGLSELLIIEEIMKRIQSQSNLQHVPRPAEYFDLIGGTSTGGLIAILLGRLGLSAGEAIGVYTRLAEQIFSEKKRKWQDGTFKATILEREIRKVVGEALGSERSDARMLEDDDEGKGCRMFVCATPALNVAFRRRFRNYRVRQHQAYNCTIWEAGRATSAAPTFFKRIEIDGEQFVDAGLGCNNPIKEVIAEAQLVFGKERKVDCIISIGTGKAGVVGFDKPTGFQKILPTDLVDVLRKMATESTNTAEEIEQRYADATNFYFRFDVDQGLQDVGLDEWKRLGAVKTNTIAYTMETNVNRKIDAVILTLTGTASPQPYSLSQLGGQISSVKGGLHPTSNIPFPRDLDFVDRGDIMNQICEKLSHPSARVALHGLGGKGKSQLAIEYAHQVRDKFPHTWVFWIHASNQARMEQGFEQIAGILNIPGRDDPKANIFQLVGQELKDVKEKWLLVVDNADDPMMFSKLAREEMGKEEKAKEIPGLPTFPQLVTPYLPHTQNGSILITSRNEEASLALVGEDKNIIHVGEMNERESIDLLFKKLNQKVDREGASELVKALEYIPLAITQAAAYLSREKGRISVSQYVKDLNKSSKKIVRLLGPEVIDFRRDDEAVGSIITTWQISFNHIRQTWPLAAEMLSLMSFFNYQGIPQFLLHGHGGSVTNESIGEDTDEDTDGDHDDDFEKCLRTLRDYCLVSLGEEKKSTFRMHRLVQASTQDWLRSYGDHEKVKKKYLHIISKALPVLHADDWGNWEIFWQLLPHVEPVDSQQPMDKDAAKDWATILWKVSSYKCMLGEVEEAEQMSRKAVQGRERLFGEVHQVTLDSLEELGLILFEQCKFEEAEETSRQLVDRKRKLYDEGHLSLLSSMAILARVLNAQGQYEEAEAMLRSVLEGARRQLPEDDATILKYENNLAGVLHNQGRYDEVELMFRQALEKQEKHFQEHDPNRLIGLNNLAVTLTFQGKYQEAEEIYRRVLKARDMVRGPDITTIEALLNLAGLLCIVRRYQEAESIGRQALKEGERVWGKEHLHTAGCLNTLAMALQGLGQLKEAEQMFRRAFEISDRVVGKDHPETLQYKRDLEVIQEDQR